jgi:cell wall-associated NlpC family hydrolase
MGATLTFLFIAVPAIAKLRATVFPSGDGAAAARAASVQVPDLGAARTSRPAPAVAVPAKPAKAAHAVRAKPARPAKRSTKARLVNGRAIAPAGAPPVVRDAIAAANRISQRPYSYGGGHASFESGGYDCSGAVSYALHGGGLLRSPQPSGALESWGKAGPGKWITVYANGGHAYAVIAGLRWDTSGDASGSGPRWHTNPVSPASYVARHPGRY